MKLHACMYACACCSRPSLACSGIRYHMITVKHEGLTHSPESWAQYLEMQEKERLRIERKRKQHASGIVKQPRARASK